MNYQRDDYLFSYRHQERIALAENAWKQRDTKWPQPRLLTRIARFWQTVQQIRRIRIEISLELQPPQTETAGC